MNLAVTKVLEQTKILSSAERAEIAKALIYDLDLEEDPEIDAAWLKELQKREKEIDEGSVQTLSYAQLKGKLNWK